MSVNVGKSPQRRKERVENRNGDLQKDAKYTTDFIFEQRS